MPWAFTNFYNHLITILNLIAMSLWKFMEKLDLVKVFLIVLVAVLAFTSGLFYYRIAQWKLALEKFQESYSSLQNNYEILYNRYSSIENYYNELQDKYSILSNEYTDLQNRYSNLEREKIALKTEYDEILRFEKSVVIEKDKTLNLKASENTTLSYDTLFAGYIEVNFTASVDIYFWVGSSLIEDIYYARYPSFPNTATNGTFIIPVCSTVYLYIHNPNELMGATVTLTIKYVY